MQTLGRCGSYELLKWVESGGMGEIYLARGPRTDRPPGHVAVKRLLPETAQDPTFVDMFRDEGRVAERLEHPNICRLYDVGEEGGTHFLAMEWVDGVSMRLLQERAGATIPVALAARIMADVAGALHYAHELRDDSGHPVDIVHRDVSPPNIMVDLHGTVKLLDFGLAKARTQLAKTQPGYVKGKFGYLAPEMLKGHVDRRADVFGIGLCLYEALVGEQVFDQSSAAATVAAIGSFRAPPPVQSKRPDVSAELERIVHKALAPNPENRYQTAAAMQEDLELFLASEAGRVADTDMTDLLRRLFPERKPLSKPPHGTNAPSGSPDDAVGDSMLDQLGRGSRRSRSLAMIGIAAAVGVAALATAGVLLFGG